MKWLLVLLPSLSYRLALRVISHHENLLQGTNLSENHPGLKILAKETKLHFYYIFNYVLKLH